MPRSCRIAYNEILPAAVHSWRGEPLITPRIEAFLAIDNNAEAIKSVPISALLGRIRRHNDSRLYGSVAGKWSPSRYFCEQSEKIHRPICIAALFSAHQERLGCGEKREYFFGKTILGRKRQ